MSQNRHTHWQWNAETCEGPLLESIDSALVCEINRDTECACVCIYGLSTTASSCAQIWRMQQCASMIKLQCVAHDIRKIKHAQCGRYEVLSAVNRYDACNIERCHPQCHCRTQWHCNATFTADIKPTCGTHTHARIYPQFIQLTCIPSSTQHDVQDFTDSKWTCPHCILRWALHHHIIDNNYSRRLDIMTIQFTCHFH